MQTLTIKISLTDSEPYAELGFSELTVRGLSITAEAIEALTESASRSVASQTEAKHKAAMPAFTVSGLPAAGDSF